MLGVGMDVDWAWDGQGLCGGGKGGGRRWLGTDGVVGREAEVEAVDLGAVEGVVV